VAGIDAPLPPPLVAALDGAAHILVAGGIAGKPALAALERLAPVTAVVGTRDFLALGDRLPETVELTLGGVRVLLTHMIGSGSEPLAPLRDRLSASPPDVVVYGDAREADVRWRLGTLLVCPGSVRPPRTGMPATCGLLDIEGPGRITAHVLDL
jgi:predicted phosphodiesterase